MMDSRRNPDYIESYPSSQFDEPLMIPSRYSFLILNFSVMVSVLSSLCIAQNRGSQDPRQAERGSYFDKKSYVQKPLPKFDDVRNQLPSPVLDEHPSFIKLYWKAWELAFRNFHEPAPGSGFVSQFIDAAFNDNIFLWDTAFMTMFCNVAHPLVPGISSLDNFYIKQHPTGEICREIQRSSGLDFAPWVNIEDSTLFSRWGWNTPAGGASVVYTDRTLPSPNPRLTLDALDNPVLAWAELESYHMTGDSTRLRLIWEPLYRYYRALQVYLRQGNGLYVTDWASMDNSPRNSHLFRGGTGVDISAQMVLFARNLSQIARILGRFETALALDRESASLADRINTLMWDPNKRFYFDLTRDGHRVPVRTVAAYWTLLAHVASPQQARSLADELLNPKTFGRPDPVPTCSADEPGYFSIGGYWRGAVWAPTNTMVIRGLELYGYDDLAKSIALKHLGIVADVFEKTGTIWENYAPDASQPGRNTDSSLVAKNFVGWSGIAPILYLLEFGVGLKPNAQANELVWTIGSGKKSGCERYRFNGHVVSLSAAPSGTNGSIKVRIDSDGPFTLKLQRGKTVRMVEIQQARSEFNLR
jgi:hypothetical protein